MIDRYYIQNKIVVFYIIVPKGISKGEYECFIDLGDFEKIKNLPLTVCHTPRDGDNYYISFVEYLGIEKYGKMNKKHLLHRWLLKVDDDERIDHKNYNGLDNRRKNLRVTTFINNSTNNR